MTKILSNPNDNKNIKRFIAEVNEAFTINLGTLIFKNDIQTPFLNPEEKRHIKHELGYDIYWDSHRRAYFVDL